jgi:pimeloyl-ACP methyl ester carboxylesterase
MKRLYCISGLGADHSVFQKVKLPDTELVPVPWPAFSKSDDVASYAQKVSANIPGEKPSILGLSFGGMLLMEIAKKRPLDRVFLVSSVKTSSEFAEPSGLLKFVFNTNIVPASFYTMTSSKMDAMFGAKTDEEKALLHKIIKNSDGHFMKWALHALIKWRNDVYPRNTIHIHGTADKIIPPTNVKPDYWIEGGEHLMIYSRADEINRILGMHI